MSMTQVYQPVIVRYLLEEGEASKAELAAVLSGYDSAVQDYFQRVLMRWPKKTLLKHDVVLYNKKTKTFSLNFDLSNPALVEAAKSLCEEKTRAWIEQRASKGENPAKLASKRYRVLKAARGQCELCGVSAKLTPIDIDHIIPRSQADRRAQVLKDGVTMHVDDERNLQALCFRCNRAKRDTDDTDFRLPPGLVRRRVQASNVGHNKLYGKLLETHVSLLDSPSLETVTDLIELALNIGELSGHSRDETLSSVERVRKELGGFG